MSKKTFFPMVAAGLCGLCLCLSAGCRTGPAASRSAPAASRSGPLLSTTIDFLDYCWTETDPKVGYFTEAQYEEVIRALAKAGIGKVNLRVDVCGLTLYPTRVGKQYPGDGREPGSTYLVNTLRHYDPVAKTIVLCRKYGLQIWCWDTIFDDEATALRYDPVMDREQYERFGEYPLKDPFLIEHPQMQWALDPRIRARQAITDARYAGPLTALRVISAGKCAPNRVRREQFDLYVSTDNRSFRRYDKPFSFRVIREDPAILELDGLEIREPYLKLAWRRPWPKTNSFSICGMPAKIVRVRIAGSWQETRGVYCKQDRPPERGGGNFSVSGPFAWDWGNRALVVAKSPPRLPDYYGVIELAYPEAKAHKLAKLKELAAYDFDGFAYSMRTHTRGADPGAYGYGAPIREAYLRRYGKDIWKEDFDRAKWLDIRAGALNRYLALAAKAVAPRPLYMDWPATGTESPYSRRYGDFPFQVEKWVREQSVAGVRVMSCPEDQPIRLDVPGADRVKLIRFVDNWRVPPPETFRANLQRWFANPRLDEVELYETILYTKRPAYLAIMREVIKKAREQP